MFFLEVCLYTNISVKTFLLFGYKVWTIQFFNSKTLLAFILAFFALFKVTYPFPFLAFLNKERIFFNKFLRIFCHFLFNLSCFTPCDSLECHFCRQNHHDKQNLLSKNFVDFKILKIVKFVTYFIFAIFSKQIVQTVVPCE